MKIYKMGLGDGVECGRRWCKDPQTELLMEALQQTNQRRESRRCLREQILLRLTKMKIIDNICSNKTKD